MTKKKGKAKESEFMGMSLDGLQDKKKEIKEFLASLENDYRNATISEKSYKHTKEVNLKKMEDLKKQLADFGITDSDDDATPTPAGDDKAKPVSPESTVPASPVGEGGAVDGDAVGGNTVENNAVDNVPVDNAAVNNVPPSPEPSPQNSQGAESSDDSDDIINKDTKGLSLADKLKQYVALSNAVTAKNTKKPDNVSSGQPVQSAGATPQASQTAATSAPAPAQNVELLMQKFSEKINVDLERIKANLDSFKEVRASTDERLQTVTEGLTELRTTVFQREAGLKEQEMRFTRVKELVDDIEPDKINKEFMKRDKFTSEMEIRIEKLEVKIEDVLKTIKHTDGLLKSLGDLENVANIDHKIAKKMEHVSETEKSMVHLSSKIEKMFMTLNEKLENFEVYEARQDNMNEIMDDTLKNVDQLGVKFESYIDKKDMSKVKTDMDSLSEKIEMMMGILKKAVPFAEAEIPKELQELEEQREDIESLLSTVEHEHKKKQISDKDYMKIKKKNDAALDKIKVEINKIMKKMSKKELSGKSSSSIQTKDAKEKVEDAVAGKVDDAETSETAEVNESADKGVTDPEKTKVEDVDAGGSKDDSVEKESETETKTETETETKTETETVKETDKSKPEPIQEVVNSVVSADTVKENQSDKIDVNDPLIIELEESLAQGLISQDTYEKTKKLIIG
ncbi:MAG: hypothetical protein KAI18_01930 [Candidatus Aenigmarchaeota archaeon]|nr:hypothetical protein [Candidatus Aenigmarchaeota archaeon]